MQRRKVIASAAAGVILLALAGCSNTPGGGSASQTLTLTASTDYKAAFQQLIADFEKANKGVKVAASYAASDTLTSTEPTQLQSGGGTDIIGVQPGTAGGNAITVGQLSKSGYLADLSSQSWVSKVPAATKAITGVGGKTYILSPVIQPLGVFYNTTALQGVGLTAPTTWTQVLQYCKAATAKGKVAYSLGLQDSWVTQLVPYALAPELVYEANADWNSQLTSGAVTFPKSAWLTVEQKYLQMKNAGCFTKNPNGVNFDGTLPPVASGKALAIVQVGGVFGNLQGQNAKEVYSLQPLPASDDTANSRLGGAPGTGMAVNAKAKNKALAMKFIDFAAQPENINKFATTLGGVLPSIPNDSFKAPSVLTTFNTYISQNKVIPFPDTGWPSPEIQNAHLVGIQNMFLGKATPEQVLTSMQAKVPAK